MRYPGLMIAELQALHNLITLLNEHDDINDMHCTSVQVTVQGATRMRSISNPK